MTEGQQVYDGAGAGRGEAINAERSSVVTPTGGRSSRPLIAHE